MADTPNIRFKGFTGGWEQLKLNDVADIVTGTTPPTKDKDNYGGTELFVSPADIQGERYVENTIITLTNKGFSLGRKLRPGSILFVSIGSTIGKVAQIKDYATTNQQINAVIPSKMMDDNFTFSLLEKESDKIRKMSAQQAVPIINKSTFGDIEIMYSSKEEQEKIGVYFANLDKLITLHRRKCDETRELKKYMLQKIFPQNGKNIPEIRFAGFTGDWEQRKFCDFTFAASERNKRDLPLEPFAITSEHGFIPQNKAHDDFGYMKNTDRTAYNIVKSNSFAYNPARINIGSIGYYEGGEDIIVSSLYEVFKTADYVDDRFLWYWFKSDNFSKWIERLQEGSVRMYFYYDKLCECNMLMPSIKEQKKIAKYFDNLDQLITLHQRKCDQLKEVKKFMLQNMFPQKG